MTSAENQGGIVLHCDRDGSIIRVIRDDLKVTNGSPPPSTLFALVDRDSREKAHRFLDAAQQGHAIFGWELNVSCDGQLTGLALTGSVTNDGIVICGSPSRTGFNKLFDEMMKIQNEQLNALRSILKDQQLEATSMQSGHQKMLEDFSQLNNELVNTQRQLALRNAELAVANGKLETLATTDGLTGLKNHRAFQEELQRQYAGSDRNGSALSLLLLDVDHFKQFNDTFGHPAGDQVLRQVAQILDAETRGEALVARYGGEEFVVVLPNADCRAAAETAERLRRTIEAARWELRPATVSIGLATKTTAIPNPASLIARADLALYRAKAEGRNRVYGDFEDICCNGLSHHASN